MLARARSDSSARSRRLLHFRPPLVGGRPQQLSASAMNRLEVSHQVCYSADFHAQLLLSIGYVGLDEQPLISGNSARSRRSVLLIPPPARGGARLILTLSATMSELPSWRVKDAEHPFDALLALEELAHAGFRAAGRRSALG